MTIEELYSDDLAIDQYRGKWKQAKKLVSAQNNVGMCANDSEGHQIDYWLAVRKFYLELGGLYKEQLTPLKYRIVRADNYAREAGSNLGFDEVFIGGPTSSIALLCAQLQQLQIDDRSGNYHYRIERASYELAKFRP